MRQARVELDEKTGIAKVKAEYPPIPAVGDFWEKRGSRKLLSRQVIHIDGKKLTYRDQDGRQHSCLVDSFRRWTDDCRATWIRRGKTKIIRG